MQLKFMKPGLLAQFCLSVVLLALVLPFAVLAQEGDGSAPDYSKIFDKIDVMIPTRDGVKLHTEVYVPKNQSGPLPIILERTPYGTVDDKNGYSRKLARYEEMIPEG